jgi:peptidoglycan-N-acetylmuramic acid deacetylase
MKFHFIKPSSLIHQLQLPDPDDLRETASRIKSVSSRRFRPVKKAFLPAAALIAAFFTGQGIAAFQNPPTAPQAVTASSDGNWGLSFQTEGAPPIGNATADYLAGYNAHYVDDTSDKVIYLTFDAGYENGCTPAILDALKKHNVSATFFLVGNYLNTSPELVKRMVAEGHTVGNHTFHHPDMSKISTTESFRQELESLETLYQQVTGQKMKHFYRPPQGKYSEANLKMAKDLGYETFFWSLAYVDWYEDKQPTREEALKKLLGRIHPGAIVLLHSTSKTNAAILDELLTKWEEMGYHFGTLEDLVNSHSKTAAQASVLPLPQLPARIG